MPCTTKINLNNFYDNNDYKLDTYLTEWINLTSKKQNISNSPYNIIIEIPNKINEYLTILIR